MKSADSELTEEGKDKEFNERECVEGAVKLAESLLVDAKKLLTGEEKKSFELIGKMMEDPEGKLFTLAMTDRCFRSSDPYRVAEEIQHTLKSHGIPRFLPFFKRFQLSLFLHFGRVGARFFIPLLKMALRKETKKVVIPGEGSSLYRHISRRHEEGARVNINHLGEAILGEEEAKRRLEVYIEDLAKEHIEVVSIKISTIYSQINLLAWEETLDILAERLRRLYRAAMNHTYVAKGGEERPKFVNLDMEEYRDLQLTVALFKKVLSEPEFQSCYAGIVLQSYLPDSYAVLQELIVWAKERVAGGGAPIKVRIVKGANLAMERVEASLEGWPQAPYSSKAEVDANYKKVLQFALKRENGEASHIAVASHNLFDIAYAMTLSRERGVEEFVSFEMLEGIADHQRRAVQSVAGSILLYCPTAKKEEFVNAVAYLVRRLDENSGEENFLRHLFNLEPKSALWNEQEAMFRKACERAGAVSNAIRRRQDRRAPPLKIALEAPFSNEPNSDLSLECNRRWAAEIISSWKEKSGWKIPLVIGGGEVWREEEARFGFDPSRPGKELYSYTLAGEDDAELALVTAKKAAASWREVAVEERARLINDLADRISVNRGELIGAMIADAGKIFAEADAEVSEAIDFCRYYARNLLELQNLSDLELSAKGVVLVTPPWNFPCAIPLGGCVAALLAGNSVIFKPAQETLLVAWLLATICWEAGIPKELLQFIACDDDPIGSKLVKDERVDSVILTGATSTAKKFLKMRSDIDLHAETGGKNAIIVSRLSDRDLAVKAIVESAFGHSGQKCSACSLLILEEELYNCEAFQRQLRDAAASLKVGSAWEPTTKVAPLVQMPNKKLQKGLKFLERGERWLLQPQRDPKNPRLITPGIKWGVERGSFMHRNELFGPLLSVISARDIKEAVDIANDTPYGLTSGIHTLDNREKNYWLNTIEAGNCYINRGITGAIVQRQPFGGCKESSYGPGAKAGGPNYLLQLMAVKERELPRESDTPSDDAAALCKVVEGSNIDDSEKKLFSVSAGSYAYYWNHYFSREHDPSKLIGQDNLLIYLPRKGVNVRYQRDDSLVDLLRIVTAALTVGTPLIISCENGGLNGKEEIFNLDTFKGITLLYESDSEMVSRLSTAPQRRLRTISSPAKKLRDQLADLAIYTICKPPLTNGRVELLHYLQERAISSNYHRYGNLGRREMEKRAPLPTAVEEASKNNGDSCTTKSCCEREICCRSCR